MHIGSSKGTHDRRRWQKVLVDWPAPIGAARRLSDRSGHIEDLDSLATLAASGLPPQTLKGSRPLFDHIFTRQVAP